METDNNASNNINQEPALNQMPEKKSNKTLIIILIVVFAGLPLMGLLTCGVVAAIATPKFSEVSERASVSACRANMSTLKSQEAMYMAENGYYTNDLAELGFDGLSCPSTDVEYVLTSTPVAGDIAFTITCGSNATTDHGKIDNGRASW